MLYLVLVFFSLALFSVSFLVTKIFITLPKADRRFYDQPPLGLKIILPLLHCCSLFFGRFIQRQTLEKQLLLLRRGGADYMLNPTQFFFATPIAGIIFTGLGWLLSDFFQMDPVLLCPLFGLIGLTYPNSWIQGRIKDREKEIFKSLPHFLDIITLSVEAGSNFIGALNQSIEHSPPGPLREEFSRIVRDIRAGKPKLEAIKYLNNRIRMPSISSFVSAVTQSEKMGSSLGKALRAQSDQRRFERFARAEKLSLEAPVKLLGPLVMFIFPTTFLIIGYLVAVKLISTGVFINASVDFLMTNPIELFQRLFS